MPGRLSGEEVLLPLATPCERFLHNDKVKEEAKQRLREEKAALDPLRLLPAIRELQATLAASSATDGSTSDSLPASKDLSEFLRQLPRLWKTGEVRPTPETSRIAPSLSVGPGNGLTAAGPH